MFLHFAAVRVERVHQMGATVRVKAATTELKGGGVFGQEVSPLVEGPVRADAKGAAFLGGGEPEQQLGAGVIERGEADFVDDDQIGA